MEITLIKKIATVKSGKEEKKFKNYFLRVDGLKGLIPIQVKAFKNEKGELLNRKDFYLIDSIAIYEKDEK